VLAKAAADRSSASAPLAVQFAPVPAIVPAPKPAEVNTYPATVPKAGSLFSSCSTSGKYYIVLGHYFHKSKVDAALAKFCPKTYTTGHKLPDCHIWYHLVGSKNAAYRLCVVDPASGALTQAPEDWFASKLAKPCLDRGETKRHNNTLVQPYFL
jgi:hypothetical protein